MSEIGKPLKRHQVVPLKHDVPATEEPPPKSIPIDVPSPTPELEPAK